MYLAGTVYEVAAIEKSLKIFSYFENILWGCNQEYCKATTGAEEEKSLVNAIWLIRKSIQLTLSSSSLHRFFYSFLLTVCTTATRQTKLKYWSGGLILIFVNFQDKRTFLTSKDLQDKCCFKHLVIAYLISNPITQLCNRIIDFKIQQLALAPMTKKKGQQFGYKWARIFTLFLVGFQIRQNDSIINL